jgi:hypothetical protein
MPVLTDRTFETQRGYGDYLRDRPPAEVFQIAVIEAEALGNKALGSDYAKYNQAVARRSNSYSGKIIAENDIFTVQKVSPLNTVRHIKRDLPHVPQVGQDVRIGYSAGICNITENLKHNRKRAHRISL